MRQPEETKRGIVVVKTYPVPEDEGVESSCTALITEEREWVRLFPLPYRYLPQHQQRQQKQDGYPTLGFFRPKKIDRLLIHETLPTQWTPAQLGILRQEHLFLKRPTQELEKIPYWFRYEFTCDDAECDDGHCMMCVDWEIGEAYRSWKRKYGDKWEAPFRQRFETEMIREKRHTLFRRHDQSPSANVDYHRFVLSADLGAGTDYFPSVASRTTRKAAWFTSSFSSQTRTNFAVGREQR
jgi:hypothetical protein